MAWYIPFNEGSSLQLKSFTIYYTKFSGKNAERLVYFIGLLYYSVYGSGLADKVLVSFS